MGQRIKPLTPTPGNENTERNDNSPDNSDNEVVPNSKSQDENDGCNIQENIKTIYTWQHNEIIDLIHSMANHIDDFNHSRKRQHVFELIVNDLTSIGYTVNETLVQNKWKSLTRSYKKAKDNKIRTGTAPSRFQYYDLMDELLGKKPSNSSSHSINSDESVLQKTLPLPSTSKDTDNNIVLVKASSAKNKTSAVITPDRIEEAEQHLINNATKNSDEKKPRQSEKKLKRDYLDMKKSEYDKRQKRHDDKLEVENRKIALFEKYLQHVTGNSNKPDNEEI